MLYIWMNNFNLLIQDIEWIQHQKLLITNGKTSHFPAKNERNVKTEKTKCMSRYHSIYWIKIKDKRQCQNVFLKILKNPPVKHAAE